MEARKLRVRSLRQESFNQQEEGAMQKRSQRTVESYFYFESISEIGQGSVEKKKMTTDIFLHYCWFNEKRKTKHRRQVEKVNPVV